MNHPFKNPKEQGVTLAQHVQGLSEPTPRKKPGKPRRFPEEPYKQCGLWLRTSVYQKAKRFALEWEGKHPMLDGSTSALFEDAVMFYMEHLERHNPTER